MAKRKGASSSFFKKGRNIPWFKLILTASVILIAWVVYLDAKLMHRFNGLKWKLPASVYARPLEVFTGKAIDRKQLVFELKGAGYQQGNTAQEGNYSLQDNSLAVHTKPFTFWDGEQPAMLIKVRFAGGRISQIEGLASEMAGSFRLEPIKIGSIHPQQHEERILVSLDEVPESLIAALLATEDRNFYTHHGISLKGIARAALANFRHGQIVQGASTITQQLVKNFYFSNKRSYFRKLEEVIMALLLETRASKDEILETYINEVFVAQDGSSAIHGFALASEFFFAKPLKQLTDSQIALLVGMMKGPTYYNPIRHPKRAIERRNLVLSLMKDQGYLSERAYQRSIEEPLNLHTRPAENSFKGYTAYIQVVKRQLGRDYSAEDLQTQGLRIFTNLNPFWQNHAQRSLNEGLKKLRNRYGDKLSNTNGAIVVVNHATGDIEAIVGGKDFRAGSFNRAIEASRPIGSMVKPAVYLTALSQNYRLSDLISDDPITLTINQKEWTPQNYDKKSHHLSDLFQGYPGDKELGIPLYLAIAKSYNIATVRLGNDLGVKAVAETLTKLGLKNVPNVPAVFLGAVDLTPIDAAQMYATFGAGGFFSPLNTIREVTDNQGQALKRYKLKLEKRFEAADMYLINYSLQAVMRYGTGRGVARLFPDNQLLAGKTGTTNDLRDNWFAGFDSRRTAVVWIGNDDYSPLPMSAATGALPIWGDLMRLSRGQTGALPQPDDISYQWVDVANDALTHQGCPHAVHLPFKSGTEPATFSEDCPSSPNSSGNIHNQPNDSWFKRWFQ